MKYKWLLVDLNSFFASCEQQDQPRLRGRPIAVVPMLAETTSVIASSKEAKVFGVKTGTKVFEARKMCPGIQFVSTGHKKYVDYHHKILEAIDEICPISKVLSIDEMACELIGREQEPAAALDIAKKIKRNILLKAGECLTSSVGLGPNIMIAKMASDLKKPDGLVSVLPTEIQSLFGDSCISVIPGVGRQMKYKLNQKGFYKVNDLLQVSEQELRKVWGNVWGMRIASELRGESYDYVRKTGSSISHEHVLPPDLRNNEKAFQILAKLISKGAARLRKMNRRCNIMSFKIRFADQSKFKFEIQFTETNETLYFLDLLKKNYPFADLRKPLKVGVGFSGLTSSEASQMSLFDDPKLAKLNQAMDAINTKFGPNTLVSASFVDVLGEAKTRIAFNHIPGKDDEF